jgi:ABC-2 type transport system permease protein
VNALRRGAGFNLAALILLWAALAFLAPTGLERLAGLAHPLPSREEQALSLRALEARSSRMREEGVSRFRKERPELFDTARVRGRPAAPLEWYPGFLAEQAVLDKARDSLESQILSARADREAWSAGLRRLAPTLAMEDFILRLAGRDPAILRRFSRRLEEYRRGIREAIWPRLIQARAFSAEEIAAWPRWRATDADAPPSNPIGTLAAMVLPTLALSSISWMLLRRPG